MEQIVVVLSSGLWFAMPTSSEWKPKNKIKLSYRAILSRPYTRDPNPGIGVAGHLAALGTHTISVPRHMLTVDNKVPRFLGTSAYSPVLDSRVVISTFLR